MVDKQRVTILFDAAELAEKEAAKKKGEPYPMVHEQVADALVKRGHGVESIAVTRDIKGLVNRIDRDTGNVLFNLTESVARATKHEPVVTGLLELMGRAFTGSGAAGMTLAQDKALAKKILQFHGLPYPRFSTIDGGHVEWADDLRFPLFVKPLNEDASIGIDAQSVVHNVKELLERISHVHNVVHAPALVEEFIEGREIYVGVLGNDALEALPILEWDFSGVKNGPRIASAEAKWDRDSEAYRAPEVFPDDIPAGVVQRIHQTAIDAVKALKLSDYARVDMRLRRKKSRSARAEKSDEKSAPRNEKASTERPDKGADAAKANGSNDDDWEFFIIEVNPNPWLEKRSEFAMAARRHGLSYPDLVERIMELALTRFRREHDRQPVAAKG